MPIKPENLPLYPKNWKKIRYEILARADYRCECRGECGIRHYSYEKKPGRRCPKIHHATLGWKFDRKKDELLPTVVVLTIAHLNHKPRDSRRNNLKAMCQGCHLAYDRPMHLIHAAETRARRRGEQTLWKEEGEKPCPKKTPRRHRPKRRALRKPSRPSRR